MSGMEHTHRTIRARRTAALVAAAAAAALALPGAASAAVTATARRHRTLTGDGANDTITIAKDGGLLPHNTLAGLETATDFDSAAGVQTLPDRPR